jgi:uncharacterized protein YcbK (DUF882 family)
VIDWNQVDHFKASEFACRGENCCNGSNLIQPALVFALDELRKAYGKPMVLTSAYRCQAHNERVSTTRGLHAPHLSGLACDVGVSGRDAVVVLKLALAAGFTGIGVNQKGGGRFLHIDLLPDSIHHKRPWIWSY